MMRYPDLTHDIEVFMLGSKLNDIDTILNYLYEGVFKITNRQELKKRMKETFKNNPWSDFITNQSIDKISEVFTVKELHFVKIEYSTDMRIDRADDMLRRIMEEEAIDTAKYEKDKKKQVKFLLSALGMHYGEENVKYNKSEDAFEIHSPQIMLAVFTETNKHWKFVKWMSGSVYKRIFPEGVVKKIATRFYILD